MKRCIKDDIRIRKTHAALHDALFAMLGDRNFNDITVNDLCVEALVSRTTFYAHFSDKYDLLEYLLSELQGNIVKNIFDFEELKRDVNHFVFVNRKKVTNVLRDADGETLAIMREFMSSILEFALKREIRDPENPNYIILFTFCSGGLVNLLTYISENNFPPNIAMVNAYLYNMLKEMMNWDAEQEHTKID